jgi:hypothetical protein
LHTDRDHWPDAIDPARWQQLERLWARLAGEADRAGRDDLVQLLDERPAGTDAPIRACVVGATKVGKSRLLNPVVGHREISAAAVEALENTTRDCTIAVGKLMGENGGGDRWPTTPATASARLAIGLAPRTSRGRGPAWI